MWSDKTRNAKIKGGQIEVFPILNICNIFVSKFKESKITRGHNYMLVKKRNRLDVRTYSFSRGPSMYGKNN